MQNLMISALNLLFLVIHLSLSQEDLPMKYITVGTSSCIQYQPFVLEENIFSVTFSKTAVCSSVVINGNSTTVIAESYRDRINCTVDRVTNIVKFCYNSIGKSDAGVYTISILGSNPQNRNGTVYVMDKPTTPTISPTSAEELKQVIFTCTSSSTSAPSPTGLAILYNWTVDETAPVDQRYSVSNNLLTIQTVQRGDKNRVLQCVATEQNGFSSDRSDITLTVTYRPVVSTSGNVTTIEGTRSQLSCNVLDANPSIIQSYNWYKDTNPTAILTTNRTFTLTSTNRQDYGVYSCKAENSVGMSIMPASVTVIVQFSPGSVTLNGSTTVNENTALTLRCEAALSNPHPTFTWYKNGAVVTVNSQVTITDGMYGGKTSHQVYSTVVRKQDHRSNITCVATNTAGKSSGSVILNIRYKPVVEVQPASPVVIEGNQTIFRCVVTDANPSPDSYLWKKDGPSSIGVNQNYTIQNVRKSDAGSYSCTSTNIAGTSTQATTTLDVLYPPEIADIVNQTPEERTTFTVTCTITTSNPAPNRIYWTRSKDPTFRQNSGVLTIPNISRGHTDTYTCHAENIMSPSSGSSVVGSDQTQVMVDVLYGPGNSVQFDSVPSTISMEENNTRSIPTVRCLAECNPPCQFSWTGNTGSSTATLNLGTATRDKNGTYTCKASNSIGGNKRESQKEMNVLIFYHALITSLEIQSGPVHNEHSDVYVTCTVESFPLSNVTWTSTGNRPPSIQQANPSSTLQLRNVSCYDTANYTCSAFNGYGSHSMETKPLFVRCTPRLLLTEKERVEVGVGDNENLTISSAFVAYPEPTVIWYFKAISMNTSKEIISQPPVERIGLNIFNSSLVRVLQDQNDFGEYKSVAVNSAGNGTAQQIYIVAANRQPSRPTNLSVVCHTSTTANISWTPGFNGGLQQWFNIMYRPSTTDTFTSSSNVSDNEKEHRQYHIIFQLIPETLYFFKVISTNSLGSVFAMEEIKCKTKTSEEEGGSSSAVIGGVAGTSAAILLVVIVIVGIFLFRRVQSKTHGDGKELSERPLASMNEVPDGIKDNILYESAGDNFSQPRQVYAEVVKLKKKSAVVKTNDVYAEVQKPKKSNNKKILKGNDNKLMADVYENVGEIKGAAKVPDGKPAERGYKNEDGLLYVDVDIKPCTDGRRNVIIGEEERTDYASVEFVVPQ